MYHVPFHMLYNKNILTIYLFLLQTLKINYLLLSKFCGRHALQIHLGQLFVSHPTHLDWISSSSSSQSRSHIYLQLSSKEVFLLVDTLLLFGRFDDFIKPLSVVFLPLGFDFSNIADFFSANLQPLRKKSSHGLRILFLVASFFLGELQMGLVPYVFRSAFKSPLI